MDIRLQNVVDYQLQNVVDYQLQNFVDYQLQNVVDYQFQNVVHNPLQNVVHNQLQNVVHNQLQNVEDIKSDKVIKYFPLNSYSLVSGLFAYLYREYDKEDSPDHIKGFSFKFLCVISEFTVCFGECQIKINRVLRPYLKRIMDENYLQICRTTGSFIAYTRSLSTSLQEYFPPHITILALCAIVSEINYYCFQRGCYRFAYLSLECLTENFNHSKCLESYLVPVNSLHRFQENCLDLLLEMEKNPAPAIIIQIGQRIEGLVHRKELRKEPTLNEVVNPKPVNRDACTICKTVFCVNHLYEYIDNFWRSDSGC